MVWRAEYLPGLSAAVRGGAFFYDAPQVDEDEEEAASSDTLKWLAYVPNRSGWS